MTPWLRAAALVPWALLTGGCSFSATFEPGRLYRLQSVNQESLPVAPGFGLTILTGTLELESDGACLHSQWVSLGTGPSAQEQRRDVQCTWIRSGDDLELTFDPGDFELSMTGVFQGERLTLTRDTGIRCVTTPCPSTWVEEYQRDRSPG